MIAQEYPKVQIVKNEVNDCQRGSGSNFLMQMEGVPLGISKYTQKKVIGLHRSQQCYFMGESR